MNGSGAAVPWVRSCVFVCWMTTGDVSSLTEGLRVLCEAATIHVHIYIFVPIKESNTAFT